MSGDTMGGVQGVLVLSWHRTEVLQGHQALTSSQDLWILLGLKGAGPPCTHGHPKPTLGTTSLGKQFALHLCSRHSLYKVYL